MAAIFDPSFMLTGNEFEVVAKWLREHPHNPEDTREIKIASDGYDVVVIIIETDIEEPRVEAEFHFTSI